MDMGSQFLNCTHTQSVLLSNQGQGDLEIYGITEVPSSSFALGYQENLPQTLFPNDFLEFSISFTPQELGSHSYELQVLSNDATSIQSITITGDGIAETQEDLWIIEEAPKSDILFSVDLSSSMSDEAITLGWN